VTPVDTPVDTKKVRANLAAGVTLNDADVYGLINEVERLAAIVTNERGSTQLVNDIIAERETARAELVKYKKAVAAQLHYDMLAVLSDTPERRAHLEIVRMRPVYEAAKTWRAERLALDAASLPMTASISTPDGRVVLVSPTPEDRLAAVVDVAIKECS
jgi:hypothetical protein